MERQLYLSGIPGVGTELRVAEATERHGFKRRALDVTLDGPDTRLRAFVPADEACAGLLRPGQAVRFAASGAIGAFERDATSCRAVGIGSLEDWRDRRPRPGTLATDSPVPREPAFYDLVYRDEEVAFLRGTFPLGSLIGWRDLNDTIAVVPTASACRELVDERTASMEYRPAGEPVLSLVSAQGPCRIVGQIQPRAPRE